MQQPSEYSDQQIDRLVRQRLEERAGDVDTTRLMARVEASIASEAAMKPSACSPVARRRWRRAVPWVATAVVLLMAVGSLFRFWPDTVQAASLIRESLKVHRLPVDRCYLIERNREEEVPEPTIARTDRLWTRGEQFFWESSTERYHWAWGRDQHGTVWLTYGRRHGIKLEPDELPPWLATLCEVLSMEMETLLGNILQGYELTTGSSDLPQTVVIHAVGQPGRTHRWLKEATLEIDRETRVVRRATVTRLLRDGRSATTTYTLVSAEAQPVGRYQLDGHLERPFKVFTCDHRPQQRRRILEKLFGPRCFTARANRDIASPDVKKEP